MTDDAWLAARGAADHAGVLVRTLDDPNDQGIGVRIFDDVWPLTSGGTQVMSNLLRALTFSGGYLSAAFDARTREPVGAALAVVGRHRQEAPSGDRSWHTHLHSHMTGVVEGHRDRSIGTAIKLHQRAWALDHDIDTIVWSFDPLVRRNAWLNLHKLGTEVRGYEPNFYGDMEDALNSGDPSDRVFAWWLVNGDRAASAATRALPPIVVSELAGDHDVVVIEIPQDIIAIRHASPDEALRWRLRVRERFLQAFDDGYRVVGLDASGSYVLHRGDPVGGRG